MLACQKLRNCESASGCASDWDPGEETNLSLRKEAPALESRRRFNDKFRVFVKPPWAINRHLITEIEVFDCTTHYKILPALLKDH